MDSIILLIILLDTDEHGYTRINNLCPPVGGSWRIGCVKNLGHFSLAEGDWVRPFASGKRSTISS